MANDELDALDALEKEAKEYDKVRSYNPDKAHSTPPPAKPSTANQTFSALQDAEIDRILKAFRLDAYVSPPLVPPQKGKKKNYQNADARRPPAFSSYAVLDLQPGVPDSDIKIQYRKKSLLIHPDKTKNPSAPDAFDRLKKAQVTLLDEAQRKHLDECIADARSLLIRKHKYTLDSPELKTDAFRTEWRAKTVEVLVEAEARRRRQLKAQMQEEGREKRREEEELEQRKRKREQDKNWEETRDERIGSWREFQKGAKKEGGGGGGKSKKQKMKVLG
jgi:DnaJ family protein C protein 8